MGSKKKGQGGNHPRGQRRWAAEGNGNDAATDPNPLSSAPGSKGSRIRFCRGKVFSPDPRFRTRAGHNAGSDGWNYRFI